MLIALRVVNEAPARALLCDKLEQCGPRPRSACGVHCQGAVRVGIRPARQANAVAGAPRQRKHAVARAVRPFIGVLGRASCRRAAWPCMHLVFTQAQAG